MLESTNRVHDLAWSWARERATWARERATADSGSTSTGFRRTVSVSAVCVGYAILASVVWSAHKQFGIQSRIELTPLVATRGVPKLPPPLLDSEVEVAGSPLALALQEPALLEAEPAPPAPATVEQDGGGAPEPASRAAEPAS